MFIISRVSFVFSVILLFVLTFLLFRLPYPSSVVTASGGVFGVGMYIAGEPDSDKAAVANAMSDLGASITRMAINYPVNDWSPYDRAVDLTNAKGVENLILLHYDGDRPSVDSWGDFVGSAASRYAGRAVGYEIFNEADNYISGTDYAAYLTRSYEKIKAVDSGAKIISSGLGARSAATSFWQEIYDAGAWDKVEAVGLHPYRDSAPETVAFNTGDFISSINIAANFIRSHGGGKKVWLTEFGVRSTVVDESTQANYIARSYIMSRAVSEVEKAMMYRYRDGSGWGMVRSDLSHKPLYELYKSAVAPLTGGGGAERIFVYDKKMVDNFDKVSGWKSEQSEGGSVSTSEAAGLFGGAMKYEYSFNSPTGFVVAEMPKSLEGSPVGLGIWAKGPSTSSVLKLRIKDAGDETFQFDMGKVTGDWSFFKFDFAKDSAKTSWGGNGAIDFPIRFDSIVYDRQNGASGGTIYLDDLVAIYGAADIYAYKIGSKLAYWKVSGAQTSSACGQNLNFKEEPQVVEVSACSSWSGIAASSPAPAPAKEEPAPKEVEKVSKEKSKVSADKDRALADNKDTITLTVSLKSDKDEPIKSSKLTVSVSGSGNKISKPKEESNDYKIVITSTRAQEKQIIVKVDKLELASLKATFIPGEYSRDRSQIIPSKWVADLTNEVTLELKVTDAFDNELPQDKKPAASWQLAQKEADFQLIQPSPQSNWKGKIIVSNPGRIVLEAVYNNQTLPTKTVLYVNPKLTKFEGISLDKIATLKKDVPIAIAGLPGDNLGVKLEGMADAPKVVVKISSLTSYFWLVKNSQSNQYEGVITLPPDLGKHEIFVYSENEKAEISEFAKGTLEVGEKTIVKSKTPVWKYVLIVLGSLLTLAIIGLGIILLVPKWRRKLLNKLQRKPKGPEHYYKY